MPSDANPSQQNEDLELVLADYVNRLIAGEKLSPEKIVAAHPDFGAELLDHLENFMNIGPDVENLESAPPLGTLGDYTLRRQIGRGGMGVVYEAWQGSLDRRVALKVLPAGLAADTRATSRFLREAQVAAKLSHPQVVSVYGFGVEQNSPYYAMEFVDGETLAQLLAKIKDAESDSKTRFGPKDQGDYFVKLARAFAGVADGLQHAHSRGVVHRDIKPSNLILDGEGRLRILDFGLARLEGHESLTISGDVVGTPLYMSPEQARRRKIPIDHRTDVYSLGATMYEAITGRPPFRGKDNADTLSQVIDRDPVDPRRNNPRVPRDLETIVLKCLRKDPADRYGTAEALGQDLRRLVRGDPIEARPQARWERMAGRVKRHRTSLGIGAVIVLLIALVVLFAQRSEEARQGSEEANRNSAQANYEPAVREALKKLYAGRFSLTVFAGNAVGLFSADWWHQSAVSPEDFGNLFGDRESDSVEAAIKDLRAAAAAVPHRLDAHYHLAHAYVILERFDEARSALRQALECDPEFVPAKNLHRKLSGENSVELYGNNRWTRAWLEAYKGVEGRKWSRAADGFGALVDLTGEGDEPYIGCLTEAHLGRGLARLRTGRYEGAQRDFVMAFGRDAGIESRLLLAKAYYLNDQREAGDEVLEDLHHRASFTEKDQTSLWVAAVYDSLGDYERGLEWIEKLDDQLLIKDRLRSYFLYRLRKSKEAVLAGTRAIERNPRDPVAHRVLGMALLAELSARETPETDDELATLLRVSRRATELDPANKAAGRLLDVAEAMERTKESRRKVMNGMRTILAVTSVSLGFAGEAHAQTGFFGDVREVRGVNSNTFDFGPTVSSDRLEIYFSSFREGSARLFAATRNDPSNPFGVPEPLTKLNAAGGVAGPSISEDGLKLYFKHRNPGNLVVASRSQEGGPFDFEIERELDEINTAAREEHPCISANGLELYFFSDRNGSGQIFVAERESQGEQFSEPIPLTEIPSDTNFTFPLDPSISGDGRTLFFRMDTSEGHGGLDVWMASRDARKDPFGEPINLGLPVNSVSSDFFASVSFDWPAPGSKLYFNRTIGFERADIYEATWHPDCNENGVDDLQEIADVDDADANGIPDECQKVIPVPFRRGDSNADGVVNIVDGVFTLNHLFAGDQAPPCMDAADTDDSGEVDITDSVGTFSWLFAGEVAPAAPGPVECGVDPTVDELDCAEYGCP